MDVHVRVYVHMHTAVTFIVAVQLTQSPGRGVAYRHRFIMLRRRQSLTRLRTLDLA
jgi:hypothetical protein